MNQNLKQPNKTRVKFDDLEWIHYSHGGYDFYDYKGKPFSGYMVLDVFPNGNIEFEEEYKGGDHFGWDNLYYENGNLKRSVLMIGATSLEYYEYNENGSETEYGLLVTEDYLEEMKKKYRLD